MKPIYHFESHSPPMLTEAMLRREVEKRRERTQMILLALSGVLLQIGVLLFGYSTLHWFPSVSVLCVLHVLISAVGGSFIAAIYAQKGGSAAWKPHL